MIDIDAAIRKRLDIEIAAMDEKLTKAVVAEHRKIADCVASKTAMPEHYWQERHTLEQKLRAARTLRELWN